MRWMSCSAKPKLARAAHDNAIYEYHLKDGFARQTVANIRRAEIGRLRDRIARSSGPIGSNNVLDLILRMSHRTPLPFELSGNRRDQDRKRSHP